jgi:hypothetical protein
MLYETSTLDLKMEPPYYQDFSINSSIKDISIGEAYADTSSRFRRKPFFGYQIISPIIQYDSSSKYPFLDFEEIETVFIDEFFSRIAKLKALDDVFGMLNELTPKQIKIFEKSISRRHLFK